MLTYQKYAPGPPPTRLKEHLVVRVQLADEEVPHPVGIQIFTPFLRAGGVISAGIKTPQSGEWIIIAPFWAIIEDVPELSINDGRIVVSECEHEDQFIDHFYPWFKKRERLYHLKVYTFIFFTGNMCFQAVCIYTNGLDTPLRHSNFDNLLTESGVPAQCLRQSFAYSKGTQMLLNLIVEPPRKLYSFRVVEYSPESNVISKSSIKKHKQVNFENDKNYMEEYPGGLENVCTRLIGDY